MPSLDYLIHKIQNRYTAHRHIGGEGAVIPAWTLLSTPTDVTGSYTVRTDDMLIACSGTFELALPAVTDGKRYIIKNIGTGVITLLPDGSETIDGAVTLQLILQYDYVSIVGSDEWLIVGGANVQLTEVLEVGLQGQTDLLNQILVEEKKQTLHLSEGSGTIITDDEVTGDALAD